MTKAEWDAMNQRKKDGLFLATSSAERMVAEARVSTGETIVSQSVVKTGGVINEVMVYELGTGQRTIKGLNLPVEEGDLVRMSATGIEILRVVARQEWPVEEAGHNDQG